MRHGERQSAEILRRALCRYAPSFLLRMTSPLSFRGTEKASIEDAFLLLLTKKLSQAGDVAVLRLYVELLVRTPCSGIAKGKVQRSFDALSVAALLRSCSG
jgi:hypothetical protein